MYDICLLILQRIRNKPRYEEEQWEDERKFRLIWGSNLTLGRLRKISRLLKIQTWYTRKELSHQINIWLNYCDLDVGADSEEIWINHYLSEDKIKLRRLEDWEKEGECAGLYLIQDHRGIIRDQFLDELLTWRYDWIQIEKYPIPTISIWGKKDNQSELEVWNTSSKIDMESSIQDKTGWCLQDNWSQRNQSVAIFGRLWYLGSITWARVHSEAQSDVTSDATVQQDYAGIEEGYMCEIFLVIDRWRISPDTEQPSIPNMD